MYPYGKDILLIVVSSSFLNPQATPKPRTLSLSHLLSLSHVHLIKIESGVVLLKEISEIEQEGGREKRG